MSSKYIPRLSVELDEEQYKKLTKYIPWGMQKLLFSAIVDDLIKLFEQGDAELTIAAIIAGIIKPRDLIKTLGTGDVNGELNGLSRKENVGNEF